MTSRQRDILPALRSIALLPARSAARCSDEELCAAVDAIGAIAAAGAADSAIAAAAEALYPRLRSRILSAPDIQAKAPLIDALHRYVYGLPGRRPGPAATLAEARARVIAAYRLRPAMPVSAYMRNLLHTGPSGIKAAAELLQSLASTAPADDADAIDRLEARIAAAGIVAITPSANEYWVDLASHLLSTVHPTLLSHSLLSRWYAAVQSLSTLPWRPAAPYSRLLTTLRRHLRARTSISTIA